MYLLYTYYQLVKNLNIRLDNVIIFIIIITFLQKQNQREKKTEFIPGAPRWLSQLSNKLLISPRSWSKGRDWDPAMTRALGWAWVCLIFSLPSSLVPSPTLFLSQINDLFLKKEFIPDIYSGYLTAGKALQNYFVQNTIFLYRKGGARRKRKLKKNFFSWIRRLVHSRERTHPKYR